MAFIKCFSSWCTYIVLQFILSSYPFCRFVTCYAPEISVTCQSTINIKDERYHAGVLVSHLPDRIPIYAKEDEHCDISLGVPPSHLIMFYFVHLDFISSDLFLCDSANIELFDGSPGNYVKGLPKQVCGHVEDMPTMVYFVETTLLIIRVRSLGMVKGSGFRIHFTLARRAFPCTKEEFACETYGSRRCIADHLLCDDWNDCGDWVDEEHNCNAITRGAIAAIVIASAAFLAIVVGLIVFCKLRRDRELLIIKQEGATTRKDTSGSIDTAPVHPATVMKISEMRDGGARYISRNSGRPSLSPSAGGRHFPDRLPPYTDICGFDDTRSDELSDRVEGHNLSLSTQQESEAYYACGDKRHSGSLDYRKERERNKDDRGHVVNVHSMDRTAARTGDLRVHQRYHGDMAINSPPSSINSEKRAYLNVENGFTGNIDHHPNEGLTEDAVPPSYDASRWMRRRRSRSSEMQATNSARHDDGEAVAGSRGDGVYLLQHGEGHGDVTEREHGRRVQHPECKDGEHDRHRDLDAMNRDNSEFPTSDRGRPSRLRRGEEHDCDEPYRDRNAAGGRSEACSTRKPYNKWRGRENSHASCRDGVSDDRDDTIDYTGNAVDRCLVSDDTDHKHNSDGKYVYGMDENDNNDSLVYRDSHIDRMDRSCISDKPSHRDMRPNTGRDMDRIPDMRVDNSDIQGDGTRRLFYNGYEDERHRHHPHSDIKGSEDCHYKYSNTDRLNDGAGEQDHGHVAHNESRHSRRRSKDRNSCGNSGSLERSVGDHRNSYDARGIEQSSHDANQSWAINDEGNDQGQDGRSVTNHDRCVGDAFCADKQRIHGISSCQDKPSDSPPMRRRHRRRRRSEDGEQNSGGKDCRSPTSDGTPAVSRLNVYGYKEESV